MFKVFHIIILLELLIPWRGQFRPRDLIGRIYVGHYWILLHTQYISNEPHGFREDVLNLYHNINLWELSIPAAWPVWTHRA